MLARARDVVGYELRGPEGALGKIDELLIDPDRWTVAYLAVRSLLLVPAWLGPLSLFERTIETPYTAQQLTTNPPVLVGRRLGLGRLQGMSVEASDGHVGQASDFFIDTASWRVTHACVALRARLPSQAAAVETRFIAGLDLEQRELRLALSRQQLAEVPPLAPSDQIGPSYKAVVDAYTHDPSSGLGRPGG
jgi:hypothetical protein